MDKTLQNKHYYREILAIGIPVIIGQLGTIVLGFADTLMIGHHSTQELAAAGLVNNLFTLVLLTYLGFSYGLTPVVGRLYGMGHKEEIGQKVKNSLVVNIMVGALLMGVMTVVYFNLHRMGQPEELMVLIRPYFLVNLVSIPFVGVFNTLKQFFDGITHTRVPMWIMIGSNGVNILLNWLLIYGVGCFPEWGLTGAGVATLASRVGMAVAVSAIVLLGRKNSVYDLHLSACKLCRTDMAELGRLGWPVALQLGMESAAFSFSCVMVGWLGTIALAAHQVAITLSQLFYMILSGLAAALSVRVSLFVGHRDFEAVRANARDGFRLNFAISLMLSVPILLFRHHLGALFNDSVEVQQAVAALIVVMVLYQFGDSLQYSFANALRGIACVKPMVCYAFVAYFVISLPLGYLLGFVFHFGLMGVWFAFPVGLTVAGILFWQRFRKEVRRMERAA